MLPVLVVGIEPKIPPEGSVVAMGSGTAGLKAAAFVVEDKAEPAAAGCPPKGDEEPNAEDAPNADVVGAEVEEAAVAACPNALDEPNADDDDVGSGGGADVVVPNADDPGKVDEPAAAA